ncbi:glycoside hydrolase family 43 protein [Goodfellowiella coeruleoviolacea]|uniref:Alpha-L-arabinofuranosidase B (ABFB) domain-containing protein n=1 Tax=Goodfellowiella coeruleoviolacea TaxID=334858 RepID=A0AAE3GAI1_9PSEU|nr:glycoside hydrolase family 43 protein [Goodfellowiella coeruleoviolacea]MCP2163424.1 Alpha-L-arabinofuranosidase B (ABFB) domain-containing protein [Goodfellowiella coeruleoviolacea]
MPLRHRVLAFAVGLATAVTAVVATAPAAATAPTAATYTAYVMGYFTESPSGRGSDYGLHLAVSPDGLNWTPLNQNNPVVTPTAGTQGLRDPHILRKQDGTFVVLATDLKGTDFTQPNQYIHAWDSVDLTSFTNYRRLKLHSMNTHTWAPEAFYDAARGQYGIVYSANNGTRDVFMVNYTTDFVTVFDPGFNVLDATVLVDGSTNYLYYKNLADGNLYGARSSTLDPRSFTTYTSGLRQGSGIEAPIVVRANTGGAHYLWGDSYSPVNGEFYAWSSTNIGGDSWSPLNQRAYTQPLNSKHATIAPITAAEQDRLLSRWGAPRWNRLKSYNYPDRYVRHQNYVGRIDAYPFDPYSDQQWVVVPGLADAAGVSFRSLTDPTRYLRHYDYALRLDANDGSATFAADATFYRTAGLADSGWASFRSYNFPDRYLRHADFVLRIDPVSAGSSSADKQDATFRVGS